jgi:dUTP pyrophosphatase
VQVILINHSQSPFQIARGDRIAQMVIQKLSDAVLQPTAVLDETARGAGGFGSTGVS